MFCPGCGTQEREPYQFCRACGGDLRSLRAGLPVVGGNIESAVTAREEIGRAVAAKIRDLKSAKELAKVVEEVLPQVEKFLESPQERRLRRLRAGLVMQAIGIGSALFFLLYSFQEEDKLPATGLGVIVFLLGLAMFLNGRYLTVSTSSSRDDEERARLRDSLDRPRLDTGRLLQESSAYPAPPPSVVEHTTRQLRDTPTVHQSRATTE